ncbi:VPA1269 family protein [Pseudomonas sp. BP01]|uniref:gamma-mobile-trio integrase GmtZ n=1 Tax=Pseudomonas sp. BP01 TaxID=2976152 RepID=UPI001FA9C9C5|nr:VPA1269 family protein [Pseudomonas sp. BP01]
MCNKKPRQSRDGRASDRNFNWVVLERGEAWESWRQLLSGWIAAQTGSIGVKINAMNWFLVNYLPIVQGGTSPDLFFQSGENGLLPELGPLLESSMTTVVAVKNQNWIVELLDWVIIHSYSEPNDHGIPIALVKNPLSKRKHKTLTTETVHNPLPYAYIRELREILCPQPRSTFREWEWAHYQSGQLRSDFGDWFPVDQSVIDQTDGDCVWRYKNERYEIWSPVRSVALYIKLHLPLRTYQVRFLDSGEADTWRYERGDWILNQHHSFSMGHEKNPWNRGVFCRIRSQDIGEVMTGLYISTNKTADQNKESRERGYTIPWQNEDVLYWLERLRNWQEKYNPIDGPTACSDLRDKHTGGVKTDEQKKQMGAFCFLFRDPTAAQGERDKPITSYSLANPWYRLLSELEDRIAARGQTLANGSRLILVHPVDPKLNALPTKTHFPLHSLRVSLLTCYSMEGLVPIQVLSKLIAGHSRIIMTLYYAKPTPAMVSKVMENASERICNLQDEGLKVFLQDADMRQVQSKTAFLDAGAIEVALVNRNALGWEQRHIGLCLVGGNSARSNEMSNIGGCWNGGEFIAQSGKSGSYGPVAHGLENCVRCRWLITDARYLPALVAHLNMLSYRASLVSSLAVEIEQQRDALLDERYFAEQEKRPFLMQRELQQAERRFEKQTKEADEYAKDLVSCFQIISRIVAIEEGRDSHDSVTKLVAVGSLEDIHQPISFIETSSELWQLSLLCDNSEIYADLTDDLRTTPAIEKRSRALNRLLMQGGYAPVLLGMDDRLQLIAGNAMMRSMALAVSPRDQMEGFREVSNLLETGEALKLLPVAMEPLERVTKQSITKLSDLITTTPKKLREAIRDRSATDI